MKILFSEATSKAIWIFISMFMLSFIFPVIADKTFTLPAKYTTDPFPVFIGAGIVWGVIDGQNRKGKIVLSLIGGAGALIGWLAYRLFFN